ncbi:hypothetical protein ARAM_006293, partial [Aspergillus rambellii]
MSDRPAQHPYQYQPIAPGPSPSLRSLSQSQPQQSDTGPAFSSTTNTSTESTTTSSNTATMGDSPPPERGRRGSVVDLTKKRVSMACLACKKSKRKCSGVAPCDNCRAFGRQCVFDETLDQRRRVAAKRTADELGYHRDMLNDLLKVMRAEDQFYALRLLEIIRRDATSEEIRAHIDDTLAQIEDTGKESEDVIRKLEDVRRVINVEGAGPSFRPKVMDIHYLCDEVPYRVPAKPWTTVTEDADLVSHLVSLYFTWDYPFHAFLDRDVFLKHMASGDTNSELCSPFLVNALLANACHFSDYSEAYVHPGDMVTKGNDFLAEAERLKDEESTRLTLPYLQGTLLLYEKYAIVPITDRAGCPLSDWARFSLSGENDLGYKMLHQAIWIGESLGLIGPKKLSVDLGQISQDMDASLKQTAWGLFHIDTVVHTDFLRPSLIDKINLDRPNRHWADEMALWIPYPSHRPPRPSYLRQYFDESCNLCEIARDMSQRLFSIDEALSSAEDQRRTKEALYERLRRWYAGLPRTFDTARKPTPYVIMLRMQYHTLVINLFLFKINDNTPSTEAESLTTPQSPKSPASLSIISRCNAEVITQSAARAIAALARLHRKEYGMGRAHHFAMYAINLALFALLEQPNFDILDQDFLSLASAFSRIASRSHLGRNLFHLFRQHVRAKRQGRRIRESHLANDELKVLFDEEATSPSLWDEYAQGLEKLNEDTRYHGIRIEGDHSLFEMLDRYESLSLGKDEIAPERPRPGEHEWRISSLSERPGVQAMDDTISPDSPSLNDSSRGQKAGGVSPDYAPPLSPSSSSNWLWRPGSVSIDNAPPTNYQLYSFPQHHDQQPPVRSQFVPFPPAAAVSAVPPKIAIPRATASKTYSQRHRSARACEPCRQRKVKCDGGKPACRKCREHDLSCFYVDIKRVRDQKQLGTLTQKVERYEKLLRQLESQVEPGSARLIERSLSDIDKPDSDADGSESDSISSTGSLDALDLIKEDLNRSEKSVAAGFFGKNSEVAWMQRLEDEAEQRSHQSEADAPPIGMQSPRLPKQDVPIMMMSYHLDDLTISLPDSIDPYALPPKELADRYFKAYMESVHPAFTVIRKTTFTAQYEQFFSQPSTPPPRWLAVLNMIFAIGCRYCKLTGTVEDVEVEDLKYLNRARKLCLDGNVLFEHADLQQIQVEFLVALYLVTLGQVNRASKFSSMAFRSAISLGINLRFEDDRTHYASKEARGRLWWSIFVLEHLLTSITGRVFGVDEGLSAAPLPIPFDEGSGHNPDLLDTFRGPARMSRLQLTLLQTDEEAQLNADWLARFEPSASLFFHCFVDLSVITQAVISKIYSIQGLHDPSSQVEQRILRYSRTIDTWLHKVPEPYRFTISEDTDTFYVPHNADYMRERITLAISYYSTRITLCRPCLSHNQANPSTHRHPRFRTAMALACLRAARSLLSILPDRPDAIWLTTVTPWWAILHFIMQATTALLIGIFTWNPLKASPDPSRPPLDTSAMLSETKKAFRWLHHMGRTSKESRRAFVLCESFLRRVAPSLGLDISDIPESGSLPPLAETSLGGGTGDVVLEMVGD